MFLQRYARDHDPADLTAARGLLRWVDDRATAVRLGGLSWPVEGGDPLSASGFELGTAGIAWVNAQAARLTGDQTYAEMARRAADEPAL